MLDEQTLPLLKAGKNLLAFSGGVDSTALFFLLREANIPFAIAHVNYHTRKQSDEEQAYAQTLAECYELQCHIHHADAIENNFEAQARQVRYGFFDSLITQHGYDILLTAHQLDDRLEWLLMQLCKGAGLPEMLGMNAVSDRQGYRLVRPLLERSKAQLRQWLDMNKIRYFEDATNADDHILRNFFRHHITGKLMQTYHGGIAQSFHFLQRDAVALEQFEQPHILGNTIMIMRTPPERLHLMRATDRWLKTRGHLMRRGEKERLLGENELVLGRRFALSITPTCTLITPLCHAVMPKPFKEQCRKQGIGPGVRPYLFRHPDRFRSALALLASWSRSL